MLLLLLGAGACVNWQPAPLPARGAPPTPVLERARLTRTDGRVQELAHTRVERDTLRAELYFTGRGRFTVAVPLDSVRALEVQAPDGSRTLLLVAALSVLVAVIFSPFADSLGSP